MLSEWIGPLILAIGTVVLVLFMLRARKRMKGADERATELRADEAASHGVRRELEHLVIDIEEMCREITARLDTKIRVLNELLIEADRKISVLEKLESDAGEETAPARDSSAAPPEPDDDKIVAAEQAVKEIAPSEDAREECRREESIESDPRFKKVFEMADSGGDILEIARETGMPKGEIKLILGLRARAAKNRDGGL